MNISHMKKTISSEEIREKLVPVFRDKGLRLLLLFGSSVSGNTHKRSDLDIAFLFDKPADMLDLANMVIKTLHTDEVDVVDLRRASPLLRYSAVRNGLLLYERNKGLFNDFYSLTFRMYVDSKKLRDARSMAIQQYLRARESA